MTLDGLRLRSERYFYTFVPELTPFRPHVVEDLASGAPAEMLDDGAVLDAATVGGSAARSMLRLAGSPAALRCTLALADAAPSRARAPVGAQRLFSGEAHVVVGDGRVGSARERRSGPSTCCSLTAVRAPRAACRAVGRRPAQVVRRDAGTRQRALRRWLAMGMTASPPEAGGRHS